MNILIVDDNDMLRELSKDNLKLLDSTLNIIEARNGIEAIEKLKHNQVEFAFIDEYLPDLEGSYLIEEINRITPNTVSFGITGNTTVNEAANMIEHGAKNVFFKPLHWEEIYKFLKTV